MSPPSTQLPPHEALRQMADNLALAAAHYRRAWQAQGKAVDAWEAALEELGDAIGSDAATALHALNAAAEDALLLEIDVEQEALRHMEQGALQLEAVAHAARRLADALLAQQGGLQ
jgi:hypothetical protein